MSRPSLWLIAGPNGAGKTTFVTAEPLTAILGDVVHLNADDRTLLRLNELGYGTFSDAPVDMLTQAFVESAELLFHELKSRLSRCETVAVETVLSTNKYQPIVEAVIAAGGFFGLIYIALSSPRLACERVAHRVSFGGHNVPPDKTIARWHRSLTNLPWYACRAHRFLAFDNSDSTDPNQARLLMSGTSGSIVIVDRTAIPELTAAFDEEDAK